jgi:hypothetical protein
MISKWGTRKNVEESACGVVLGTTTVKMAGFCSQILTQDVPDTKQEL